MSQPDLSDNKKDEAWILQEDDCRFLLLKMVEQAVRDYLVLSSSIAPIERYHFTSAEAFIFDEDYLIKYGEYELALHDILGILNIEADWFRNRVLKLKDMKVKDITLKLKSRKYSNSK